jgi:hypothetical protein
MDIREIMARAFEAQAEHNYRRHVQLRMPLEAHENGSRREWASEEEYQSYWHSAAYDASQSFPVDNPDESR